ncbi:uncharacterized protein LOC121735665 [Aricia agestis]|uniref:uncharacterized protein LOC121735665 n=1 Tax=Aricia agestis TaxID=91739 RepID=UPI001C2054CE|nr:uncharacterized protein LOC121735665 [Aricia agestis]
MKTAVVLATLVALALASPQWVYKTKPVDHDLVLKQKQILNLFHFPGQVDTEAEYYKIGHDFSIEEHIDHYTNKKAVEEFLELFKTGFLPKNKPFSVFYERQREEAVALFHLFFYAKDFETFYKTAAFARIYMNEGQFLYAYYIALIHREDTKSLALPAPYEVWPKLFTNLDVWQRVYRTKMQEGTFTPDFGMDQGVMVEDDRYVIYANYSDYTTYHNDEYKISYFTEDIGLNAYYFYFHAYFPFWMDSQDYVTLKERRGEVYFYAYQQILARYYLERLANGMGEIPDFSWWEPIKTGYSPYMSYYHSFVQRPEEFLIPYGKKSEELQLLDTYEKTFIQYLERIHFKAYNQEIDLRNSKSVNFVGNFWQANADLHSKIMPNDNHNSYEVTARHILSAAPEPINKYNFIPSALDFYQTSMRDPIFYQMYSKIMKYIIEYKKYLTPYTQDMLHYVGVKINSVKVDKLVTFFDYYNFDVSNGLYFTKEEMKSNHQSYFVRQPRLNHKPFTVSVDVKSDVEGDAVFKIFLGPKYDSKGYPISLEDNWQNFVELDWFVHKLVKGQNKVERSSTDFFFYKEDSAPVYTVNKMLTEGKLPSDMTPESYNGDFPKRLLLPKGSKGGFPFQLYVMVYPYEPSTVKLEAIKNLELDNKPFGYPFDRPVHEVYFKQPNMYFEEVEIFHEGEDLPWKYNIPFNTQHYNDVNKHLPSGLSKMKTAVVLAALVAIALGSAIQAPEHHYKTKTVDNELVLKQKEVLKLFMHKGQVDTEADYYKLGASYHLGQLNVDDYTNKKAVEEFLELYKSGFMPKNVPFSIFYERQREEAVALFHLFFYAKDFETFYKTAAAARISMNEEQFLYAYYVALVHRPDTKVLALPAPYEVWPKLFSNSDVWQRLYRTKMQGGLITPDFGIEQGVMLEDDHYVFYSNYSDYSTYSHDDFKISYFTEDIGLNAYYFYFHVYFPFWMNGDEYPAMKERRGEVYYYFYQQILARYYLERLANGMSEIPDFSWWEPIKTGYSPYMNYYHSFVQRPEHYSILYTKKAEEMQLLDTYEKTFIQYLEKIHFKAYNQEIDLHNSKSVNFIGNFWQANADLHGKMMPSDNHNSYEVTARHILSAAPEPVDKYSFIPSALDFYQTSMRDPIFYQMYSKIMKYIMEFKKFLTPYTQDMLHYVGVKINSVKVDKLITYFDFYDFEVTNGAYYSKEELKSKNNPYYVVRQPRLNHKPFTVTVDVKSDIEGDAVVKMFLGPKYDSKGYPISIEDNWQNFVELDWFVHKLVKGENKIERMSSDFFFYKEDSAPIREMYKMLADNKLPTDMLMESGSFPKRLLLPKGTKGGFPFQLYVIVYPYQARDTKIDAIKSLEMDSKPMGYPFDRPVHDLHFRQPNMYFEDIEIVHEGEDWTWRYNVPHYISHDNEVKKH